LGIEFTILAFLGFISTRKEAYEKLVIYFLAQVFGRFVLMVSLLSVSFSGRVAVALLRVAFKMGFVGGHLWAARFVRGLSTICLTWFLVYLKVGPLAVAAGSLPLISLAVLTSLLGLSWVGTSTNVREFLF